MPTNVPAPTFTATGFVPPTSAAVLAGVQADINAAFGGSLNFALNTPQGQLASSWAAIITNVYQLFQLYTNLVDPAYSSGRMQDAIARIYFLQRNPAEPTTLQCTCSGLTGVVIPAGALIQDTSGNLYAATQAGTIPAGGSVTVPFAAQVPGPTAVPAANAVSIYQAILGWDSVTVASGLQGVSNESAQAFESRRQAAVAANSFGAIGSIAGAIAQVSGVTDFFGYDNSTSSPVTISGVTVAANSVYLCVAGSATNLAVGEAILSKKPPGCGMTGTTSVTVYDNNPLYTAPIPYTIKFTIPTPLQLAFAVQLVNSPNLPSNAQALVATALINAVTQGVNGPRARIGSVLYATEYIPAINALGSWAQVASITIGSPNTPATTVTGHIDNGAAAAGTIFTVTAGSGVAVGQILADTTGAIAPGTSIQSFGSGGGGTGTYNVNVSQLVASESVILFTANQSVVSVQANQEPQLVSGNVTVTHT